MIDNLQYKWDRTMAFLNYASDAIRNTTNLESVFTSMTLFNEWNHHENIHCVINNKYAFTGYIRKRVSDKKSDRHKAVFSVHTGW